MNYNYFDIFSVADLHLHHPRIHHIYFLRRRSCEVDDAPCNKRPAVVNAYFYSFAIGEIGNFYFGAERQFFMCSR